MEVNSRNNGQNTPDLKSKVIRARSLPRSRPFFVAALCTGLQILSLIGALVAAVLLVITPSSAHLHSVLGGAGVFVIFSIIAFFKRRGNRCPLCKGTPLFNSGARPHSRARQLYPFNHGMTATLSIIATHRFRCMYCGSDFDLLKTPAHLRDAQRDKHAG